MWAIRFLNGKLAGQEIPLQEGDYILGRGEDCQITVPDEGISKKHAKLLVDQQGVFIKDLKSSNGTFLNGVKIQESEVQRKDKISVCKTTFDIVEAKAQNVTPFVHGYPQQPPGSVAPYPQVMNQQTGYPAVPGGQYPQQGIPPYGQPQQKTEDADSEEPKKLTLKNWFTNYLDKVVLPGVYKLPVWLEFKWVIGSFLIFFVVMLTALSAIPLIQILNSSVAQESMNHAESIARTLAEKNAQAVLNVIHPDPSAPVTEVNIDFALRRPGVEKALIIEAANGKIIAPTELAHTYSKIPFVNEARKKEEVSVKKIDSNTVGAMVPIQSFNKKTSRTYAAGFAVVIYNTGTLALGNKRTISLLIQNCLIAVVLGVLVFFFLYKMIEFPIISINKQLSSALKDESLSVQTDYDFTPLQNLTTNINSALSRITSAQEIQQVSDYDRMTEMNHMIEMIGYPTLGIELESMKIMDASAHFEEETGVSTERILNQNVQDIDDQALKLNLNSLIEKVQQYPQEIASDSLEFSGVEFQLSAKGIYGKDSLAYILISFIPINQEEKEGVG